MAYARLAMSYEIKGERNQLMMFPPLIEDFIPEDDSVRFIDAFVDSINLEEVGLKQRKSDEGRPNYASSLLLKVWLYGNYERITSCRQLEKMCRRDVGMMWLSGMQYPDHNTLWRFFKDHKHIIKNLFKKSGQIALKNNMIGFVAFAIDGTKIPANINHDKVLHKSDLEKLEKSLDRRANELEQEIEKRNQNLEPTDKLPEELRNKKELQEKIKKDLKELETSNKQHLSKSDSDATYMKTRHGIKMSYNAQASVDSKHGIIVGAEVRQEPSDNELLTQMIDITVLNIGKAAEENLADGGYFSGRELSAAEEKGYSVLVNIPAQTEKQKNIKPAPYNQHNFAYDDVSDEYICPQGGRLKFNRKRTRKKKEVKEYICKSYKTCPHANDCSNDKKGRKIEISEYKDTVKRHAERLDNEENKKLLSRRKVIVEPVFGFIKENLKFRRFTVRGKENVSAQWFLACLIYNLRKMYRLKPA